MAPFWRGLNDWSSSWAEHQLVAAARGLAIPAADDPPDPDLIPSPPLPTDISSQNLNSLTVAMGPRTLSAASDRSGSGVGTGLSSPASPEPTKTSSRKPRTKALAAALSISSRNASSVDLTPKEVALPHDPFVNGQPMEAFLYKDATECPICFLTYPPYLNRTRCCDQSICSECFVQIKRADPHLPEHHPDGQARDPTQGLTPEDPPEMLTSEPSCCPYCQQPEFGVTYDPPPFRRGFVFSSSSSHLASGTAMSSQSSLHSTLSPTSASQPGRRRGHSLSANAPNVITTDRVRPDWSTKLNTARAHQARRAAAATALHTAAFLMGGNETRPRIRSSRFGRRDTGNSSGGANTPGAGQSSAATDAGERQEVAERDPNVNPDGSRRTRMDELEDMMFMEAVRLSLAAEEDRKRKVEKALRKEAKKQEQAERKALKKQAKDPYGGAVSGASGSSLSLGLGRRRGNSATSNLRMESSVQGASQPLKDDETPAAEAERKKNNVDSKGKAIDRGHQEVVAESSSQACSLPIPTGSSRGGSHLRQMSNASSIGSSLMDSPFGSYTGQGPTLPDGMNPTGAVLGTGSRSDEADRDAGTEPMFNFRSLAELVGVNLDDGSTRQDEDGGIHDASSNSKDSSGRPLSQVKEDEKAEAEAEHIEEHTVRTVSLSTDLLLSEATQHEDQDAGNQHGLRVPSPRVTITPGTPEPLEQASAEAKQLGQSSITEHTTQVTQ